MIKALFSSSSGLRIHEQLLNVVGNNVANINTTGFKVERARFSDVLSQQLRSASAPGSALGGTNPLQVGVGAQVSAVDANFTQGAVNPTGRELDMAIEGDGFFVVRNGQDTRFTRSGAFSTDSQGFLVDPGTGSRVQRTGSIGEGTTGVVPASPAFQVTGNNDIFIPSGTVIPGIASSLVNFRGNLDAKAIGPLAETLTTAQPLLSAPAVPATAATLLNGLTSNVVPYVAGDNLVIAGNNNGTAVNTTLAVDGTTTVGDVLTAINTAFPGVTATLSASGNIVLTANNTGPYALSLTIADAGGNVGQTTFLNQAFHETVNGKDGDTRTTAIQVFDTQGAAHNVTLTFQKQASNTWDLTAAIDPSEGTIVDGSVTGITFNTDGSFYTITGTGVGDSGFQFQWNGIPTPQDVEIDLGVPNTFNGLTQFGGFVTARADSQDGFAAGGLVRIDVSQEGILLGKFSNGRDLQIAQVAVAKFANNEGLVRDGGNYYDISPNSGSADISAALIGGRGGVRSQALEGSNVDIGAEFTTLITAQRGYELNARTLSVASGTLESLTSIVR